jgi:hypothetical protein
MPQRHTKTTIYLIWNLSEFHKCMGILAYKIKDDSFLIADPTCGLCGDRIVYPPGQNALIIDVKWKTCTWSNDKEESGAEEEQVPRSVYSDRTGISASSI